MSITTVYARAVPFPPVLYCTKYSVLRPCGFLVPCSSPGGGGFRHDKLPPFRWGHVTLEHSTGLERFLNPQQKDRQGVNCSVSAGRQTLVYLYTALQYHRFIIVHNAHITCPSRTKLPPSE